MKLKLRQVFFDKKQPLDPGCTPYSSVGYEPEFYETQHIMDLTELGDHKDSDYWGLTSWRMYEKTGNTYDGIKKFIQKDKNKSDVYLYFNYGEKYNLLQNKQFHIGKIIKRLYNIGAIPFKNDDLDWINIFCNYWIARPGVVDRYIDFLKPAVKAMKSDPEIVKICTEEKFNHRGRKYPLYPFVCEYMFGLFLLHNPDVNYKRVTDKITEKYSMKTLKDIYKKYQGPGGFGDKGTLHHYIESYDRLFTPYRYGKINVLEIGICKGHSLKMWREYFPDANIYGIDIDVIDKIPGVTMYQADQSDRARLEELFPDTLFDIIIDDGSHKIQHQLLSAKYLWGKMRSGGLYIIEDIQEPKLDIPTLSVGFRQPTEIIDTREVSGRYDDILMVWKK